MDDMFEWNKLNKVDVNTSKRTMNIQDISPPPPRPMNTSILLYSLRLGLEVIEPTNNFDNPNHVYVLCLRKKHYDSVLVNIGGLNI